MLRRNALWLLGSMLAVTAAFCGFQQLPKAFRVYPSYEIYDEVPLPQNYDEKTELIHGRLVFPTHTYAPFGRRRYGGDWVNGGTSWTVDYPRGDRHFADIIRRLTRIHVRSAEQPVNLDDGDDIYNFPWIYANMPGTWNLSQAQAKKLRDYLNRGGFLVLDNFFGTAEWDCFFESFQRVYPDQDIVDLEDGDQVFHTVYDLGKRFQIAGVYALRRGVTYRADGYDDRWRAIRDDKSRIVVMMSYNSDMGDSWEWADDPTYPEKYSALGLRLGVNYVVYAMTH